MTADDEVTPAEALGAVLLEEHFPAVDLALRRGRHIDRDDGPWYALLQDGQALLEAFYRRYGCELVHRSDGFFYLLPSGDRLGRRRLSLPEMIVGQAAALLYLDPETLSSGGVVTRAALINRLATVMGTDGLMTVMGYTARRVDERVAQQVVRRRVGGALRKLASLGFVDLQTDETLRLRPSLMRFADPVRGGADALERLLASGDVVLGHGNEDDAGDSEDDEESDMLADASADAQNDDSWTAEAVGGEHDETSRAAKGLASEESDVEVGDEDGGADQRGEENDLEVMRDDRDEVDQRSEESDVEVMGDEDGGRVSDPPPDAGTVAGSLEDDELELDTAMPVEGADPWLFDEEDDDS